MQASSVLSISQSFSFHHYSMYSPNEIAEISAQLSGDFSGKLKFDDISADSEIAENLVEEERFHDDDDDDEKQQQQHQDESLEDEEGEEESEDDDDDEEFEFSFVSTDPDGSPISADDIFSNGEIRPIFPLFNRDLLFSGVDDGDSKASSNASSLRSPLRKIFVEERDLPTASSSSGRNDSEKKPVGEYCEWTGKAVEASPDVCKKSNSTGFSRLWRFRDLLHRSSSDGKDAFVFLHNCSTKNTKTNQDNENVVKIVKVERRKVPPTEQRNAGEIKTERRTAAGAAGEKVNARVVKGKTAMSAHEKHYTMNRATKEGVRRRSYLPYRQDLVGFFTNVNGLSRNVHPF